MNKKEILDKIKDLEGLNSDEKAFLINLVNTKKKYGLVWEDKPEDVEEELRAKLPVLKEVKERAIVNDTETEHHPNHILIEGDNLHALTALTFTHDGKIDMIYIDPPYNTGNKDFVYNDSYIDKEDAFRHSKWLSFMEKRLTIAKRLLAPKGVIFISIDDNEVANLTVLCNEIFSENNLIGILPTIMNLKGNQDQFSFAGTHEYTIVYAKDKKSFEPNELPYDQEELEKWEEDEIGYFKKGAPLRATGTEASREDRPYMFYPLIIKNNIISTIEEDEFVKIYNKETNSFDDAYIENLTNTYLNKGFEVVWPKIDENNYGRWRWGFSRENKNRLKVDGIINRSGNYITFYKKQRPSIGEIPSKKPKSLFYKPEYSSGNGTSQLKSILGGKFFDNPKPRDLIIDFLRIGVKRHGIVLDFFAGSGTTLDAILHLNEFEKTNIQGIVVTNNENEIAEKVTYKRIKELMTNPENGNFTNSNLRYFKTSFIDREPSLANKRQLTLLATELLCIKEDCYKEITSELASKNWHKLFTGANSHYVYIIYDDAFIEEAVELLKAFITQNPEAQIKVYVFSNGQYAYAEEFEEVAKNIRLAALPDAIYKAYQYILPKQNKEFIPELEEETPVEFDNGIEA